MDEERNRFEEGTSERTSAETDCSHGPLKESYGLSDQGKLLSQVKSTDDKEQTTPVPPSDNEVPSSPTFAGITQFSNVMCSTYI